MVLLDLTATFDVVDYSLLRNTSQRDFGVTEIALKWFRSYFL